MKNLKTTLTALITPFRDGTIDLESLERLLDQQIKGGIGGFVVNGTTAESPTLSWPEVEQIFRFVRDKVGPSVPLVVGTGSNATQKTIEMSLNAQSLGADAILVVVPYYNKPPQRGLVAHFRAVADAVDIPMILYNVPSRTITSLSVESITTLARHRNIIGIKEASGNISFAREIIDSCGSDFLMLSGDDGTYAEFLEAGGHGVISVASHIIPGVFAQLIEKRISREQYQAYRPVIDRLFCEANPIPVKKALKMMGLIASAELRLPLVELQTPQSEDLAQEMKKVGLL